MKPALSFIALLIVSMLMMGCDSSGTFLINNPVSSTPRQFAGLEFTVSASKSRYARGEDVPLTFTVKNVTSQTLTAEAGSPLPIVGRVTRSGAFVWEPEVGTVGAGTTFTLAPGESLTFQRTWNQRYLLSGQAVPPDQYQARFWFTPNRVNGTVYTTDQAQANLATNFVDIVVE